MAGKAKQDTSIDILTVQHGSVSFCVLGTSPIILNRMSEKVLHELLMPKGKKSTAEKASTLKHEPLVEFRASPYIDADENGPTLIQHLASAFKGSLKSAALDLPGANKSQIGRLTWVNGEKVSIFGIPKLLMSVTRSADIARTPDVRTRAIIPHWACEVTVSFVMPNLREQAVANLLASAGITQGIGDWRPGKGAGTYGQFRLCDRNDPDFQHLVTHCGRTTQVAAMESPECYDRESEELLEWFQVESNRRGFKAVA
jgi:hypothetical protein